MEIFIPNNIEKDEALARTTHLAVAAHQDDIEFMAYDGILKCFENPDLHFTAVVATDGSGSPRSGIYADYTNEDMMHIRKQEQKKAAIIGNYNAQIFLDLPSVQLKNPRDRETVDCLKEIILKTKPSVIYTHNPADKHDTHVAVILRLITALRELNYVPDKLYGCEVWRSLDWVCDKEKVAFHIDGRPNLEAALMGVFDSQISGGKRYDLAVIGRRHANATFSESHGVDEAQELIYAVDLTVLLKNKELSVSDYITEYINRFCEDVRSKIERLE